MGGEYLLALVLIQNSRDITDVVPVMENLTMSECKDTRRNKFLRRNYERDFDGYKLMCVKARIEVKDDAVENEAPVRDDEVQEVR